METARGVQTLSERERQVLALVANGHTNAEIATMLDIRFETAKWHVSEIISKLGVESREAAAEEWRAQNRLAQRLSRMMRGLLVPGVMKAVAASVVTVIVGGVAIAGAAALRGNGDTRSVSSASEVTTPTPVPTPDLATNDGLTLRVVRAQIDDVETTIDVVLEGRPELGHFASPAFLLWEGAWLEDEAGNVSRPRQMNGNASDPRFWSFTFDPVSPTARVLKLTLSNAGFVNAASQALPGQRPPDPSATIAGPWVAEIREFTPKVSLPVQVDTSPRKFGPAAIAIDEIRQSERATVVYAHLIDFPRADVPGLRLQWELVDQSGMHAGNLAGRWGDGPGLARIEWQFTRTSGPVTLTALGSAQPPMRAESITFVHPDGTEDTSSDSDKAKEIAAQWAERAERIESAFAGTAPAEWKFVLP